MKAVRNFLQESERLPIERVLFVVFSHSDEQVQSVFVF